MRQHRASDAFSTRSSFCTLRAIAFTLAGGIKLIGVPGMVQEFAQIGLGQWFRYFTGALEVSGAIGLLIPKVRFWAAMQIAVVMVGATVANLTLLHVPVLARVTATLLALALLLAWLRRADVQLPSGKAGWRSDHSQSSRA